MRLIDKQKALTIALWLGLFFLSVFFIHWRLKSAYSATYSYFRWAEFGPLPAWVGLVLALRWPMRFVGALGGLLLVVAEWRGGLVTGGLRRALAGRASALAVLAIVGAASGSYYLLPGEPAFSSDAQAYVGYAALAQMSLARGEWPFWTNFGGMGMPFLQFYGPLYVVGVALAGFLIPDLFAATKAVQFVLHIASVVGMYAFVARLTGSRGAGFAAAWAYGFTFYRYHAILFTGILHLGVHLALMPWQFYCIERMLAGPGRVRAWAGFTLLGGALILAHPNYGMWVNMLALLYGLLRVWSSARAVAGKWRLTGAVGAGLACALIIGAYPVAGSFIEPQLVATQWFQGARSFLLGPIRWEQAFTFLGSFWTSEWFGGYVGVSIALLALAGVALAAAARQDGRAWALALGVPLALTLYLALGPAYLPFDSLFQRLPLGWIVYVYSTPGRYLAYVTFFAAAGVGLLASVAAQAGWVGRALARLKNTGRGEAVALAVVLLVSADVLPPAMQANSLRPANYAADFRAAYGWLGANNTSPAARALDPVASPNGVDAQQFAGLPSFGSVAHEIPALAYITIGHLQAALNADFAEGELGAASRNWLYVTNTAYLVTDKPVPEGWGERVLFASGPVVVLTNLAHSPALASAALRVTDGDEALADTLAEMQIDVEGNRADFLPVAAPMTGGAGEANGDITLMVTAHEVLPQRARLTYDLSAPGYVQLAYSYYPYLRVLVDGVETPVVPSRLGLVVFHSPPGTHTVELIPHLAAWRVAAALAGLAVVVVAVLAALFVKEV